MPADKRRFSPAALLLAALLFGVFVTAGIWQLKRAAYKDGLQAQMIHAIHEPAISVPLSQADVHQLDFHRLVARGRWLSNKTVFIDNKFSNGVVGYHVITPLRLEGSERCVLVNRGWIAAPRLRSDLPPVPVVDGAVDISGIARVPSLRFLELSPENVDGRVWQNLTIERFAAWSGLSLQPVVIYQERGADDGLMRVEPAPEASGIGADRHRGYAFLWFSLAALTLILTAVTIFKVLKTK